MTMTAPRKPRAAKAEKQASVTLTVQPGPRNAYTDAKSGLRYYRWQGRDLPSVTSIRRMAGLPHGLHQWALGKVIEYTIDHLGDLHGRLAEGDPGTVAVIKSELRGAATAERDKAAELGTAVHDAAATGRALTDVHPDVAPRLRQYLDWLAVSGAEILGAEFQCWNLTLGYAGTADLLCRFPDGSIWLVDLKTGKGVYGEHGLQLIAYLMAEFVGEDDTKDERLSGLLAQARGMAVLHLSDKHWEFRSLRADPETWTAFRGLLSFGVWSSQHQTADDITLGTRRSLDGAA